MWMQLLMRAKHIVGLAATVENRSYIRIGWADCYGHDLPIQVLDITGDLKAQPEQNILSDTIYVRYASVLPGMRTLKIRFLSNDEIIVKVMVPSGQLSGSYFTDLLTASGQEENIGYTASLTVPGGLDVTTSYARMPISDPSKVFNPTTWSSKGPGNLFTLSSEDAGSPDELVSDEQSMMVIGAIGLDSDSQEAILDHVLNGEQSIVFFSWTRDLMKLPVGNVKVFEVCSDPTSPSWYRLTGDDSNGNAIPSEYLNGVLPAKFISSGCSVWGDLRTIAILDSGTGQSDASITAAVTRTSVTPNTEEWDLLSAFTASKLPTYPAISSQDFTFTLVYPDGTIDTSGLVTQQGYQFTGLERSKIPYILTVEEDATGSKTTTYLVIDTVPAGLRTEVPIAEREPFVPTECFCNDPNAINYEASAGATDPCGICFECINGQLSRGGIITGTNLIKNNGSSVQGETLAGSDGSITFNGSVPVVYPDITAFLPTTYELDLYSVSGNGILPTGAALIAINAHHQPSYQFTGLVGGWYMVSAMHTGLSCNNRYWFFVPEQETATVCSTSVDFNIDNCTGLFTATTSIQGTVEFQGWYLNGVPTSIPVQVQIGDLVTFNVKFSDGCPIYNFEHTVTEQDLDCPQLQPYPSGCMDPTALNFDPTATIDAGTCVYGTVGCMDPTASNFNPEATASGDCQYLCTEPITPQDIQSAVWFSPYTGLTVIPDDPNSIPDLPDGAYLVTVTTFNGCVETTPVGINTPLVFGCMDPLSETFLPSANLPFELYNGTGQLGEPCRYQVTGNPCVPKNLQDSLKDVDQCLNKALDLYHARLKAGMLSKCFEKDVKSAMLIRTILHRRGLECVFNCKDSASVGTTGPTCGEKWAKGGPSGQELIHDLVTTYRLNDIVLHSDGNYYIFTGSHPRSGTDPLVYDPENPWKRCMEPRILFGDNVLDGYFEFLLRFCTECNISTQKPSTEEINPEQSARMGGETIEINDNRLIL